MNEPIDDIIAWSSTQPPWRQDCLRRLALSSELTDDDHEALVGMIKKAAGFSLTIEPPQAIAFSKDHFGGVKHPPIILKGIASVTGVNRLAPDARLQFCPKALTIVYGRNGSGKSGFVRILRTACRTRIENPATLKVLADVYGDGNVAQTADILIDAGAGEISIAWTPSMAAAPQLMQVAVFDSASAQLYVDGGNQIRYLPFGLALPHRLNAICLTFKSLLEAEQKATVGNRIALTRIGFVPVRETSAQKFDRALSKKTTDDQIENAASFTDADAAKLEEVSGILAAASTAAVDMATLVSWIDALALECATASMHLADEALAGLSSLKIKAQAARGAAMLAASALFDDDPLDGVGSASWRALWVAARDYSVAESYPERPFPVLSGDGKDASCVLCQQPLQPDGADRMKRFQAYMDDTLDTAATLAEKAVSDAAIGLPALKLFRADDFAERLQQVRARDSDLADELSAFQVAVVARSADGAARLAGDATSELTEFVAPSDGVKVLAAKLSEETEALAKANDAEGREKLLSQKADLEDLKILSANKAMLTNRRDLMMVDAAYATALGLVATAGITKRANELLDTHLTAVVVTQFETERDRFGIKHLKVGLARKSGQTKAEYEIDPQTKLAKITSQILSEGEQRALALAAFLTEVALTEGAGPIVIDDPVSSLDRDRSAKVAERIAQEAQQRQVVVFTHDIVFFNELCRAADAVNIDPVTIALFSDQNAAGKIDPTGMVWKGLNVAKRIGHIKSRFAPIAKLHTTSPADYEYEVKGLYGRLRDTYERMVEEVIFSDIVRRGTDVIQTQLLRFVTLPDDLALRFHGGMTRANTYSHDNPASDTVPIPTPEEFNAHVAELEALITDFKAAKEKVEAARPEMRIKK